MQGRNGERSAPLRQYPTEFAIPATPRDGVAWALRDAFVAENDLPADLCKLLERIG